MGTQTGFSRMVVIQGLGSGGSGVVSKIKHCSEHLVVANFLEWQLVLTTVGIPLTD